MLVVGLTGGIATGKSTVSTLLRERYHIPIVDADTLARDVVRPGTRGLAQIVSAFGPSLLLDDGTLDRKKLGQIIFTDAEKRRTLNEIVHPAVRWGMFKAVLGYWIRGHKLCVLDVPLLIEGGLWRFMSRVVVVYCPEDIQLERLMLRDSSTKVDAESRLKSQMSIEEKRKYAYLIIDNSSTQAELHKHVETVVIQLRKEASWVSRGFWLPLVAITVAALFWRAWRR